MTTRQTKKKSKSNFLFRKFYGLISTFLNSFKRLCAYFFARSQLKGYGYISYAGCLATWKTWKSGKMNSLREIMENSGKMIKTQGKL